MKETAQARYAQIAKLENLPQVLRALRAIQSELTCAADGTSSSSSAEQVDLEQRVALAIEAIETTSPIEGLSKIQEICCLCDADPALDTIMRLIEQRVREHLTALKQQAQTATQSGDLPEAEELLLKLRTLDFGDVETAKLYADVRQRRVLEEKLRSIERDANIKLASNSPMDAMQTLRQGLYVALVPDVNLPSRAREILSTLVVLGDRDDGLALGKQENWQQAQYLMSQLWDLRLESWLVDRAGPLVDLWVRLMRDNALRGVVASSAQLGNLFEAYRAAAAYLKAHPQEQFAIQQLTERQESLINQLNESANKRLRRAQTALEEGEFALALHNLQDIEADFYAPVDQEFPGLLDGWEQVQVVRNEMLRLQTEAEKLQALYEQTSPRLDIARQAYENQDWAAAEKALDAVPAHKLKDTLPDLYNEAETLRQQINQGRKSVARVTLQRAMSRIETGLLLATTRETLDAYLYDLEALQQESNLQLLDVEERNRYFALLAELHEQRESFEVSMLWEAQIEASLHAENYEGALTALDEALKVTREAARIVELKSRREQIASLAQEQQERAALLEKGRALFTEGKYSEARTQFTLARQKGIEVTEWLDAARAGALLQKAQQLWESQQDGEGVLLDLEDALALIVDNEWAAALRREIKRLMQIIETKRRYLEEDAEQKRRDAEERQHLIQHLETQITKALAHPQDYVGAVRALENTSSKITGEIGFADLCLRVQEEMRVTMETALKEYQYAQVLEWAEILKRLPRLDTVVRDWVIGLPGVRSETLLAKLQIADAAIDACDEARAKAALRDAERIAAPEGDLRIMDLTGKLSLIQIKRIEKEIQEAYQTAYQKGKSDFGFDTLWLQIEERLTHIPPEQRSSTEVRVKALRDHVLEVGKIWHKYLEAQELLRKGRQKDDVSHLKDAEKWLDEVIQCPLRDEVVDSIRRDAEKLQHEILLGVWGKTDLKMVKQRLLAFLIENPREQSLWQVIRLVLVSEYLEGFVEQSAVVQKRMEDIYQQQQKDMEQYNQMTRREAKGWYWASLCFAVLSIVVFIYALVVLLQSREALDYLTPLYTLLPGLLSVLFFNQYNQANRRIDTDRERIGRQTEDFGKQLSRETEATHGQLLRELQNLQFPGVNEAVNPVSSHGKSISAESLTLQEASHATP